MIYFINSSFRILGLWMIDLTISQIMQESIEEDERGVVNGVQNSLNQLMSMIKDVGVIALPDIRTFGILIIISYMSVSSAFVFFCVYSRRVRIFHLFENIIFYFRFVVTFYHFIISVAFNHFARRHRITTIDMSMLYISM